MTKRSSFYDIELSGTGSRSSETTFSPGIQHNEFGFADEVRHEEKRKRGSMFSLRNSEVTLRYSQTGGVPRDKRRSITFLGDLNEWKD